MATYKKCFALSKSTRNAFILGLMIFTIISHCVAGSRPAQHVDIVESSYEALRSNGITWPDGGGHSLLDRPENHLIGLKIEEVLSPKEIHELKGDLAYNGFAPPLLKQVAVYDLPNESNVIVKDGNLQCIKDFTRSKLAIVENGEDAISMLPIVGDDLSVAAAMLSIPRYLVLQNMDDDNFRVGSTVQSVCLQKGNVPVMTTNKPEKIPRIKDGPWNYPVRIEDVSAFKDPYGVFFVRVLLRPESASKSKNPFVSAMDDSSERVPLSFELPDGTEPQVALLLSTLTGETCNLKRERIRSHMMLYCNESEATNLVRYKSDKRSLKRLLAALAGFVTVGASGAAATIAAEQKASNPSLRNLLFQGRQMRPHLSNAVQNGLGEDQIRLTPRQRDFIDSIDPANIQHNLATRNGLAGGLSKARAVSGLGAWGAIIGAIGALALAPMGVGKTGSSIIGKFRKYLLRSRSKTALKKFVSSMTPDAVDHLTVFVVEE